MTGCNCDHRADRARVAAFVDGYRELVRRREAAEARRRERKAIVAALRAEGKATGAIWGADR